MRMILACLLVSLAATPVLADPGPAKDAHAMATDDCARARKANKVCVLDMKGEEVGGATPTAGGSATTAIKFLPTSSLIHIRRDFIVEILKTAEDL